MGRGQRPTTVEGGLDPKTTGKAHLRDIIWRYVMSLATWSYEYKVGGESQKKKEKKKWTDGMTHICSKFATL